MVKTCLWWYIQRWEAATTAADAEYADSPDDDHDDHDGLNIFETASSYFIPRIYQLSQRLQGGGLRQKEMHCWPGRGTNHLHLHVVCRRAPE